VAVVHCASPGTCTKSSEVPPPVCPSFVPACNLRLASTTSFANRGLAIVLGPSRAKPLSRSASSVALLT
jgi:hypothetical protein